MRRRTRGHVRSRRSSRWTPRQTAVAIVAVVAIGLVGIWKIQQVVCHWRGQYAAMHTQLTHTQQQLRTVEQRQRMAQAAVTNAGQRAGWPAIQRTIEDGVVQLFVQMANFDWLRPFRAPDEVTGVGSGFFINPEGDIITNYHLVAHARSVKVRLPRLGQEQFKAEIVGVCPERDIALLRLPDRIKIRITAQLGTIPFLSLGDSDGVIRTQEVMALGFPLGRLSLKSTIGNVSGWERIGCQSFIQLTSPLNPGNSGGPAVNEHGAVIGVNAAGIQGAQNTGFFIPITEVKHALHDLRTTKLLRKPILGGDFAMYLDAVREYLGNPAGGGWYVTNVYDGTLLAKAGVQRGDVLYEINGYKLDKYGDIEVSWATDSRVSVLDLLNRYGMGDTLSLVVYRRGQRKEFVLRLDDSFLLPIRKMYPDFEPVDYELFGGMVLMQLNLNVIQALLNHDSSLASTLTQYLRPERQYENVIIVTHVFPGSPAQESKLIDAGMILDTINGLKVRTLSDVRRAMLLGRKRKFLTMTAQYDRRFAALSYEDICREEPRLARAHHYTMSRMMKVLTQ